jgi:hypothetical protein
MNLRRPNTLLVGILIGSVIVGAYDALAYWHDAESTSAASRLWPFAFSVLLAMWLQEDSRGHPEIFRPFEFSYLLFFLWLPYLPYYLWRTRKVKGLLLLAGILVLACLSQLLIWGLYVAS